MKSQKGFLLIAAMLMAVVLGVVGSGKVQAASITTSDSVFITEWTVPASTTIKIPIPSKSSNNYQVDYGDGTVQSYTTTAFPTHTYTSAGTYTIKIKGTVNMFGYNAGVTPTTSNTYSNYYTFTQYVTKLVQWGELNAVQYGFSCCTNLAGNIPVPTTNSFRNVESFQCTFNMCDKLTGSIPDNLFSNCSNVTSFQATFQNCEGLTGNIPSRLFRNCWMATQFGSTFNNCTSLTGSIPAELFSNCSYASDFMCTFSNCKNLTGSIPAELFMNLEPIAVPENVNNIVTAFSMTFNLCSGLTSANINTTYCGYRMFYGCNNLTDITIEDNVQAIGAEVFKATSPYSSTNLLTTNLRTINSAAQSYDWTADNRKLVDVASFITEWTVPANTTIKLPISSNSSNNYQVDYGDGTVQSYTTEELPTHTYTSASTYTIKIRGKVNMFGYGDVYKPTSYNSHSDYYTFTQYLTKLVQWGELDTTWYAFSYCVNLAGNIPEPTANSFKNATGFSETFNKCSQLTGSIPENLFANCSQARWFGYTFADCSSLTGSIPEKLFANCPNVLKLNGTFENCDGLTGNIPEKLFANCLQAEDFFYTFNNCTGLTGSIPEKLFANCSKATSFNGTFFGCSGLTGNIPENLFVNCLQTENFTATFADCISLTGSIPEKLFARCSRVTDFGGAFFGCRGLTGSIPEKLFANCSRVTDFNATFSDCTGLTGSIPEKLFANCSKATNFVAIFCNCIGLTGSIPEKLFVNCSQATSFRRAFEGCIGLTGSIPQNLFTNNTAITLPSNINSSYAGLTSVFEGCIGLTSVNINTPYCGYRMFYSCNGLTDITIGDKVQSIGTDAFEATSPYSSTNLLATNLQTTNSVAQSYNWNGDNRNIDPVAPSGKVEILPTYVSGEEVKYFGSQEVTLQITASDNVTATENLKIALLNEDEYATATNEDLVWENYTATKSWRLSAGSGQKKVYLFVKDEAGNQSQYLE